MATSSHDLAKIGMEAFALSKENQPPQVKHVTPRQAPLHHHHNGREVLDCYQAAKKFGGVVIVEHRAKRKPAPQTAIRKLF